jgi:serpin B
MRRALLLTTVAACVLASFAVDGADAKGKTRATAVHRVVARPAPVKRVVAKPAIVKKDATAASAVSAPAAAMAPPALTPERLTPALDTVGLGLLEALTTAKDAPANIAISPASLASILALLDLGASPEMRLALHKTLALAADKADAAADLEALRGLIAPLMASKEGSPLSGASALLFDPAAKPFPLAAMGLKAAGAEVSTEKLSDPAALERINAFVAKATNGLIPKILDQALNALYFKDAWQQPFDPNLTKPGAFTMPDKKSVTVPMMNSAAMPGLMRTDKDFTAVRLPYATKGFSLVLLTTTAGAAHVKDFRPALAWLTGEGFKEGSVTVTLPRFSLASSSDLLPGLDKLGLRPARLNPKSLSGLSPAPQAIAKVVQKAVIKVDEKGTEAAAATVAATQRDIGVTEIKFDRPFLFALQHEASGLVLMAGYVSDPSKAE